MGTKQKSFLLIIALILLVLLGAFYYSFSINRINYSLGKADQTVVDFVVKPGEKVYEIGQHLKEDKLMNSATLFKIYVKIKGLSGQLQAGNYKIARNLSLVEVANLLQHGTFDVRLTFPEGWRREEMAQYLSQVFNSQNPNFSVQAFLEESVGLEGYLFPDTYVVPFDMRAADLVKLMRSNFDKRIDSQLKSDVGKQGLTLEEAVILSSIVERESNNDKDRPVIAGILLKRLKSSWPLEADATVQYALSSRGLSKDGNWWPKNLTEDDLDIESPFNTRKYPGLPPGPISNPGLQSFRAVVYPLETPYWFYLTGSDGVTHYAKTLEEHGDNISRYLP